jgi:phytoene synthase
MIGKSMNYMTRENRSQFNYARSMTSFYSKSFYFSASLLPREKKWATFALYGFCRYIDNLSDNPNGRSPEQIRKTLQAIKSELKMAYQTGNSEHPVIKPFIAVALHYHIPIKYPLELIKGVWMDTHITRYQTFDDLYLFCYRVAGVVGLMMTHILGYKNEQALHYAEKLGIAMQLTNILRDIKEDKQVGRLYLPIDELMQFGCSEENIVREKMTNNFRNLMQFQIKRAHSYYEDANKGIPMLEKHAQFAIYSASKIYRTILRKLEIRNYNPFLGRVYVSKSRKIGILIEQLLRTKVLSFSS